MRKFKVLNLKFKIPAQGDGFTLIEILVSLAIFTVVLVVITQLGLDLSGFTVSFGESLEVQEELSRTAKIMAAEIRAIGPADTGAYPIAVAAGNTISFYSDYNGDEKYEQIRYFFSGSTLMKGVIKPSGNPAEYLPTDEVISEVVHNITSNPDTLFTYYGTGYSGIETPLPSPILVPSIRLITITISSDQNPNQAGPASSTASITVAIRNFRTQQ